MKRWQWALTIVGIFVVMWLVYEPPPHPPTHVDETTLTEEQREYWRKMFETPIRTPDEWQKSCDPMAGKKWGNESLDSHCTIQVVVDCPPDCGVYKTLREDKLLRRIWP